MALSAIELCARALIKLGATPITGFEDGSAEASVASLLYAPTREALLSLHPWTFATAEALLTPVAGTPIGPFTHSFPLPPDFLRALSAGPAGHPSGTPYRIAQTHLHADPPEIVLSYIFRASEEGCPPFFDRALILCLAAEFCLPLTESTSRAEFLTRTAEDAVKQARLIDSQQDTAPRIERFPLIDVRG